MPNFTHDTFGNKIEIAETFELLTSSRWAVPGPSVVPTVSSAALYRQRFGDGTNDVFYLLGTVNAGDDVVASNRLKDGGPGVFLLNPAQNRVVVASVPIIRLDVVCIGDTTSASLSVGEIVDQADTVAQFLTAMQTWDISEAEDARVLLLSASARVSGGTSGAPAATANYVDLFVQPVGAP